MSQAEISRIVEVGIDYITTTSHQRDSTNSLYSFGRWLVSEEVSKGCKHSDWRASGYRGFRAGDTCVGISRQGTIVRASAQSAASYWNQLYHFSDNVTRLDVQVTTINGAVPSRRIAKHHKEARRVSRQRGRPASFKVFYGPGGAESIHLGSRQSDRYLRIYDKGLESGLPEYEGAVRYELELKRDSAKNCAAWLDSQENDQAQMVAIVHKFLHIRGTRSGFYNCNCSRLQDCSHSTLQNFAFLGSANQVAPEVARILKWLHVCVRPSVSRLEKAGLLSEVRNALSADYL